MTLRPVDWADNIHTEAARSEIVGTVRYHHAMKSLALRYARDVVVWLPPSYSTTTTTRYPVLYVHDGQNVFDASTRHSGTNGEPTRWQTALSAGMLLWRSLLSASTTRAIGRRSIPMQRRVATTQTSWPTSSNPSLIAPIEHNLTDVHTAVMGASSGGTISFLSVWRYPDVFSKAAWSLERFHP